MVNMHSSYYGNQRTKICLIHEQVRHMQLVFVCDFITIFCICYAFTVFIFLERKGVQKLNIMPIQDSKNSLLNPGSQWIWGQVQKMNVYDNGFNMIFFVPKHFHLYSLNCRFFVIFCCSIPLAQVTWLYLVSISQNYLPSPAFFEG